MSLLSLLKPKRKPHWAEYLLILAFISVVAVAVTIQLHENATSVFTQINSSLQVSLEDGVTFDLGVIGHQLTHDCKPLMFSTITPFIGSDGAQHQEIPNEETIAIGPNGDPMIYSSTSGLNFVKCFKLSDPRIHLGKDGRYYYVEPASTKR